LKKVLPASLREQLYESIMDAILTNQYHPGEVLQIDRLAHDFGVSTTPVREALVRLEGTGLVRLMPNRGAQVTAVSNQDVSDIWEVRKILEPFAARAAAEKASDEEMKAMERKLHYVLSTPEDFASYLQSDLELHELLSKHLTNKVLIDILEKLGKHYTRIRYFAESDPKADRIDVIKQITSEHLNVLEALMSRDATRTAEAVLAHLKNGEQRTLDALARRHNGEQGN